MSTIERRLGAMRTAQLIDAVDLHVALRLGRRARMEDPDLFAALALAIALGFDLYTTPFGTQPTASLWNVLS